MSSSQKSIRDGYHTLTRYSGCAVQSMYSGTSIYRFSRDRRKQTMNAGKRSIRETITHYTLRGAFKF